MNKQMIIYMHIAHRKILFLPYSLIFGSVCLNMILQDSRILDVLLDSRILELVYTQIFSQILEFLNLFTPKYSPRIQNSRTCLHLNILLESRILELIYTQIFSQILEFLNLFTPRLQNSRSSVYRIACLIHKGTLKSCICSRRKKNDYFQLQILCKSDDLRIPEYKSDICQKLARKTTISSKL